jgi:hypothetical protein
MAARAMAMTMRVECQEESNGFGGKSDGNKGANNQLAMGACDKEVKGGKAIGNGDKGGGQQRGQGGQRGGWHQQQGCSAMKRAMVSAARAMASRVAPHVPGMLGYVYFPSFAL